MFFNHFIKDQHGATAIEYGLIAAGIAVAISASVFAFGGILYDEFYSPLIDILDG